MFRILGAPYLHTLGPKVGIIYIDGGLEDSSAILKKMGVRLFWSLVI